jgi:uncharacterized protein (DUF433 family)
MSVAFSNPDPVAGGFYTVREAARLLRIDSSRRVRDWLTGHSHSDAGPIIRAQYKRIGQTQELGFLDLMEVRFIEHFRRQEISLQSLRKAAENARKELNLDHPFATSDVRFMTDRKEIFLHTAKEEGDTFLLNLMTNQIEIYEALEQALARDLTFDPQSGIARRWRPMPGDFPNVVVDPLIAYGQPVIEPSCVPTAALHEMWKAENKNVRAVAEWFEISGEQAEEAIYFEAKLA